MTKQFRACIVLLTSGATLAGCQAGQSPAAPTSSATLAAALRGPLNAVGEPIIGTYKSQLMTQRTPVKRAGGVPGAAGLYVAQSFEGTVNEYEPNQRHAKPFCQTPVGNGYVLDIGIDAKENLWVPAAVTNEVLEFSGNCASGQPRRLRKTLSDLDGQAAGIAFDSKANAFVDNIIGPGQTSGDISIYAHGAKTPTGHLNPPSGNVWAVYNVAVDGSDNVYFTFGVDGVYFGEAAVDVFPAGSGSGNVLTLQGTWKPIGIAFDSEQNMVVVDTYYNTVFVFSPPYTGQATHTIKLHDGATLTYAYVTLNKQNTRMYLDNQDNNSVEVYSYPSGKYLYSITDGLGGNNDQPTGVAIAPRAPN